MWVYFITIYSIRFQTQISFKQLFKFKCTLLSVKQSAYYNKIFSLHVTRLWDILYRDLNKFHETGHTLATCCRYHIVSSLLTFDTFYHHSQCRFHHKDYIVDSSTCVCIVLLYFTLGSNFDKSRRRGLITLLSDLTKSKMKRVLYKI